MTTEAAAAPRVWVNPRGVFNSLVVLTGDRILVGKPKGSDEAAITASLESGKGLKAIDLSDVAQVRANQRNDEVKVIVGVGKKGKSVSLEMADGSARQELLEALHERLGAAWDRRHIEMSPMRASVAPAVGLLIIAVLTFVASKGAAQLAEGETVEVRGWHSGIKHLFVWAMETLGPTGILILGGVIAMLTALVLANRLRKPPIYDELVRT